MASTAPGTVPLGQAVGTWLQSVPPSEGHRPLCGCPVVGREFGPLPKACPAFGQAGSGPRSCFREEPEEHQSQGQTLGDSTERAGTAT